jgi:MYXO-CTERM domain-containing protein
MGSIASAADTVVQINVDSVLDGRTVTTVANGVITTWTPGDGLDQDGNNAGFVTTAVEALLVPQQKTIGGKANLALPDDGIFPATTRAPVLALNYSNAAPIKSPQTHVLHETTGNQSVQFAVPPATYSKLFLVITSSQGAAALTITLSYAGGASPTTTKVVMPDYGHGGALPNDPVLFNLIGGMYKWSSTNQEEDTPTHGITGIELNPTPTAMLTGVTVTKTNAAQAIFWSATGIATSADDDGGAIVDGSSDGSSDASADALGGGGSTDAAGGPGGAAQDGGGTTAGAGGAAGASGANGQAGTGLTTTGSSSTGSGTGGAGGSSSTGGPAPAPQSDAGCSCRIDSESQKGRTAPAMLVLLGLGVIACARRPRTFAKRRNAPYSPACASLLSAIGGCLASDSCSLSRRRPGHVANSRSGAIV